jgi:hypothetical protein
VACIRRQPEEVKVTVLLIMCLLQVLEDITETGKWVARDGSCINYGSIDPDEDLWDPDGNKLIDPDKEDPDSENDEYTGNEGKSAAASCQPFALQA